ncbi:MAG: hypothetical protein AB1435_06220 [Chloroflexota bacterium]|jgi:hypothetical protein
MSEANEQVYVDVFGNAVVLTSMVRTAILAKHPEVSGFIDQVGEVLRMPDEVRQSVSDNRIVLYYQFKDRVLGGKWVVVVVKRIEQHFISTIYATDKIKSGDVIWTK